MRYLVPVKEPQTIKTPLFAGRVSAGFPSPAEDYLEASIDLNKYLLDNPVFTIFVRAEGRSMHPVIRSGEIMIVDRKAEIRNGDIVLALLNNEYCVKYFQRYPDGSIQLLSENPRYDPINIPDGSNFEVCGKVTGTVRKFGK